MALRAKAALVAFEIDPGLGEHGLIALQGSLGLDEGGFGGPGVDVDERIALVDELAFAVVDGEDASGDLAEDGGW